MTQHHCSDCGEAVTKPGRRCRSCGAKRRWATTRKPKRPFVEFEGIRYYPHSEGYWRSSRHTGHKLLHRAVWESVHGPLAPGLEVHHKDENPGNNDIGNLVALTTAEHQALHPRKPRSEASKALQSGRLKAWWEKKEPTDRTCEECGATYKSRGVRPRFCSIKCNSRYFNRRRKLAVAGGC